MIELTTQNKREYEVCMSNLAKDLLKKQETVLAPVVMASPVYNVDFSGDGDIELVLMEGKLLLEVTVYISRTLEFGSLHVSDIIHQSTTDLDGTDLKIGLLNLKEKVLDIIDRQGIYSAYLEELNNVMGTYEPVKF